jgi:predicted DNA-binding protein (MmcQ/YjbR family)
MAHPLDLIRTEAEKYPEAEKAFLFGDHEVYRVKKKVFVWLGEGDAPGSTYVSVKLKDTQGMALSLPFVTPSAYGMAKYGWISADFPKGKFPESLVREWILESYRHTAPKKLLARLDGAPVAVPAPKKKKPAKSPKKKQRARA